MSACANVHRPPDAAVLDAWERGMPASPTRRALLLLSAASEESADETLAALGIGARDARLLGLREALFGDAMVCVMRCPECGEDLEFQLAVADIAASPADARERHRLDDAGHAVEFHCPTSADLLALSATIAPEEAAAALFARCVLRARAGETEIAAAALPADVRRAVIERMAELDPAADVRLDLACAGCGAQWTSGFDVAAYVWDEVDAWARALLREVHTLARAYGWSENAILRLGPTRRRVYLNLLEG